MKRLLAAGLMLVGLAAALSATASAAPSASYTVTCSASGSSAATWSHVRLDQVTFQWFAASDTTTFPSDPEIVKAKSPRGSISVPTAAAIAGVSPTSVRVMFDHADGTVTMSDMVPCS
jgi:hypothetical protein